MWLELSTDPYMIYLSYNTKKDTFGTLIQAIAPSLAKICLQFKLVLQSIIGSSFNYQLFLRKSAIWIVLTHLLALKIVFCSCHLCLTFRRLWGTQSSRTSQHFRKRVMTPLLEQIFIYFKLCCRVSICLRTNPLVLRNGQDSLVVWVD